MNVRPWLRRHWIISGSALTVVVVIAATAAAGGGQGGSKHPSAAATPHPTVTATRTPPPAPKASPPATPAATVKPSPSATAAVHSLAGACADFQRKQFDGMVGATLSDDIATLNKDISSGDDQSAIEDAGMLYSEVASIPQILAGYRFGGSADSERPTLDGDANAFATVLDQLNSGHPGQVGDLKAKVRSMGARLEHDIATYRDLIAGPC